MRNKRFDRVAMELKKMHDIDVVTDILLGRPDRIFLYAEKSPLSDMVCFVISGTLERIGFPDSDQIAFQEILNRFDADNRYADVAGSMEYRSYVENELNRAEGESNVTFPIRHQGTRHWIHILMHPVFRKTSLVSIFITDVTETMIVEEQNYDRSHRDSLTGLFNKYTLDYHYGLRYRFRGFHAMYLDLDDFKSVNDTYGHVQGDQFLRQFSTLLKRHEDGYNRFYRLGGDEFIGLVFGDEASIRQMAEDIVIQTRAIRLTGLDRIPTVSIGIVRAEEGEDVIRKADQVMYRVKRAGKNGMLYRSESEFNREVALP